MTNHPNNSTKEQDIRLKMRPGKTSGAAARPSHDRNMTGPAANQGPLIYTGIHMPSKAHALNRSMLSLNRIEHRTSDFRVNNWILDSGAFTRIASSRGHLPVEDYARQAARWASCGTLDAVVTQDYMCEPHILDLTGLTVPQHQQLSTENFLALRELVPHLYVMPVIQGYTPEEYADHVNHLSPHLPEQAWTGVGSLCKRQGSPSRISAIITAIKNVRPDLKLHGFGLKTTALCRADIWHRFHSVDSAAWSYAARRRGQPKDRNSIEACIEWTNKLAATNPTPSQMAIL